MVDILIGQYLAGSSALHRTDARVKIILLILYAALLFMIKKPLSYAIFAAFTAALTMTGGIGFKTVMKSIKPLRWIIIFTAAVNLFFTKGEAFFSVWKIAIAAEGIDLAVKMTVRLLCLITASSLLTLTTPPMRLTDAVESLLSPLARLKVPVRELAMMMSITLRFIPVLAEEADRIIKAQTARGADFGSGGIIRRAKSLVPVMLPLFISAFKRAEDLAAAMDARCFISGAARTKLCENRLTPLDARAGAVFVVFAAAVMAAELW